MLKQHRAVRGVLHSTSKPPSVVPLRTAQGLRVEGLGLA